MFEGFTRRRIEAGEATFNLVHGGQGPPLLLLHGYPQTHVMWHRLAPRLAGRFTVVAPDLRGYGDSDKPPGGPDHAGYSKRAMAWDQVAVMAQLGFDAFLVVGHDRGARVAHRMALDHPDRVRKAAVLDIVPTWTMFATVTKDSAMAYYHWFFLSQPHDLPERLIGGDPEYYLRTKLERWSAGTEAFAPEAVAEYVRCFRDPATIHATCEDYRAGATIDLVHDRADLGRRVTCPLLALWGARGFVGRAFNVLAVWRERAADVRGRALSCGHFPAEEAPDETLAELLAFLAD